MPNMFRDVVDPTITVGSRTPYTLSASLIAHTLVVAALMVMPLVARGVLPTPAASLVFLATGPRPVPAPPAVVTHSVDRPTAHAVMAMSDPNVPSLHAADSLTTDHSTGNDTDPIGIAEQAPGTLTTSGIPGGFSPPSLAPPFAAVPLSIPRVGGLIRPPAKIKDFTPAYPPIAMAAKVQGLVIIEATIGPSGRVQDARVLRGHPLLNSSALGAVHQWEFTPTLLNGQPIAVIMTVTVDFKLR